MRYHLSNRQRKEIDRANALHVILPAPWHDQDAAEYVREVLEVPPEWIREVWETTAIVDPHSRNGEADTLQRLLGAIRNQAEALEPENLPGLIRVEVIAVRLCRFGRQGKTALPFQWPGRFETSLMQ